MTPQFHAFNNYINAGNVKCLHLVELAILHSSTVGLIGLIRLAEEKLYILVGLNEVSTESCSVNSVVIKNYKFLLIAKDLF